MQPLDLRRPTIARCLAAVLLAVAVVNAAQSQQPGSSDPGSKQPPKQPEFKWPTEINGKDINAVMKDMEDSDPTVREFAVRTLPMFGPPAQKEKASQLLLKRLAAEKDPGVRIAVINTVAQIQFEKEADNKEALRLLVDFVSKGQPGSPTRMHAVQAIGMFGPKGSGAITVLTGEPLRDPSYEIRRSIAQALGRIGLNETKGPNMRALTALADILAKDVSAAVRLEALQSLVILGPPWEGERQPDGPPPAIDTRSAKTIVDFMKARVGDPKSKKPGAEKDKQVEIWARLVLMRFDPSEINDDNLDALSNYLTGNDPAAKIQALTAIGLIGELAARKLSDVIRVMEEENAPFGQVAACVQVITSFNVAGKPAIPHLVKMRDARKKELAAKELELAKAKKEDEIRLTAEKTALEEMVRLLDGAIKYLEEAKERPKDKELPKKP